MTDNNSPKKEEKAPQNWLAIGIALGVAFGMIFGLLVFDNPALGLGVGIAIGVSFGVAMDNRKKS
ncbi:hypothetical protein [Microbacterium marinilacus]|uniref:Glycine zipper-like domain-containing protein n=1 Tax=Microbacterium marinilacus TaxID=415209 RepID=A0ABP7BEJ5_9MICO|nr:hypothetical protein [Microbacterium marinilacus]MBY0690513.1 hypothetical protein [Microbacterium marinilacus]